MKKLVVLLFLVYFQPAFAQRQPNFFKLKRYRVAYLSDSLRETSGLTLFRGQLLTLNDGGNTSEIFKIDKETGKILAKIQTRFINDDWEAVENDGSNLYIGDFGNNDGSRQNLNIKIFRPHGGIPSDAAAIQFFYPEQKDFTSQLLNTDFDAESMVCIDGQLHIFTKEWNSKGVSHYVLDPSLPSRPAHKTEFYKIGYFVTDAAYFDKKLFLIGYTRKTEVYLSVFDETEPGRFFTSAPKLYYLGSALKVGQIEGIAVEADGMYISGEAFQTPIGKAKQSLYFIPKEKWPF